MVSFKSLSTALLAAVGFASATTSSESAALAERQSSSQKLVFCHFMVCPSFRTYMSCMYPH